MIDNPAHRNPHLVGHRFWVIGTEWGAFGAVASTSGRIAATFLPQAEKSLRRLIRQAFPLAVESQTPPPLRRQVEHYFHGQETSFNVEIDLGGQTEFRRGVLESCRRVPFGKTCSYADLARAVGNPAATRAVGSAMAHNPLPLIIPCHRVLRSDGSLGGFSSPRGTSQKFRMLLLENPSFRIISRSRGDARRNAALVAP